MTDKSIGGNKLIDRRTLLGTGAALAAAGPVLLRGARADAASGMTVIDAQVHAYAANTPERPWHNVPNWPAHVTGDEMVAAMDKVGVDGAIFISAFSLYRYDASYAVEVQRAHPGRLPRGLHDNRQRPEGPGLGPVRRSRPGHGPRGLGRGGGRPWPGLNGVG